MVDKSKLDKIFSDFPLIHDAMKETAAKQYVSKHDVSDGKFDCEDYTADLIKNLKKINIEASPVKLTARGGKQGYIRKGLGGHAMVAILKDMNPHLGELFQELATDKVSIEPQSASHLFTDFDELLEFYSDRKLGNMFQVSDETEMLSIMVQEKPDGKVFGVELDYPSTKLDNNSIS